jgi:hypothetical protein
MKILPILKRSCCPPYPPLAPSYDLKDLKIAIMIPNVTNVYIIFKVLSKNLFLSIVYSYLTGTKSYLDIPLF